MPNLGNTWNKLHGSDESHTTSSTTDELRFPCFLFFAVRLISILLCDIVVWYSVTRFLFNENIAPSRFTRSFISQFICCRSYLSYSEKEFLSFNYAYLMDWSQVCSLGIIILRVPEFVDISTCAERIVHGGLISASRKSILRLTSQTCAAGILSVSWSRNTMLLEK